MEVKDLKPLLEALASDNRLSRSVRNAAQDLLKAPVARRPVKGSTGTGDGGGTGTGDGGGTGPDPDND